MANVGKSLRIILFLRRQKIARDLITPKYSHSQRARKILQPTISMLTIKHFLTLILFHFPHIPNSAQILPLTYTRGAIYIAQ